MESLDHVTRPDTSDTITERRPTPHTGKFRAMISALIAAGALSMPAGKVSAEEQPQNDADIRAKIVQLVKGFESEEGMKFSAREGMSRELHGILLRWLDEHPDEALPYEETMFEAGTSPEQKARINGVLNKLEPHTAWRANRFKSPASWKNKPPTTDEVLEEFGAQTGLPIQGQIVGDGKDEMVITAELDGKSTWDVLDEVLRTVKYTMHQDQTGIVKIAPPETIREQPPAFIPRTPAPASQMQYFTSAGSLHAVLHNNYVVNAEGHPRFAVTLQSDKMYLQKWQIKKILMKGSDGQWHPCSNHHSEERLAHCYIEFTSHGAKEDTNVDVQLTLIVKGEGVYAGKDLEKTVTLQFPAVMIPSKREPVPPTPVPPPPMPE